MQPFSFLVEKQGVAVRRMPLTVIILLLLRRNGGNCMRYLLIMIPLLMFFFTGCAAHPVRHLASDASLIKPGVSSKKDVLLYLGEPNGQRSVSPGVEEYVYYEEQRGTLGRLPVAGDWIGGDGYEMIVVTLKGDLVTDCQFRTFSKADQDWVDDFTWQDIK